MRLVKLMMLAMVVCSSIRHRLLSFFAASATATVLTYRSLLTCTAVAKRKVSLRIPVVLMGGPPPPPPPLHPPRPYLCDIVWAIFYVVILFSVNALGVNSSEG